MIKAVDKKTRVPADTGTMNCYPFLLKKKKEDDIFRCSVSWILESFQHCIAAKIWRRVNAVKIICSEDNLPKKREIEEALL